MSDLAPAGNEILVNTVTQGDQSPSSLSVLAGGNEVTSWIDDSSGAAVAKFRVMGPGGTPVTGEIAIGSATQVQTAALTGGGFVVTWIADDGTDASVHTRIFDAAGATAGADQVLSSLTDSLARAYHPFGLEVTALTNGGFAATWTVESHDNFGIRSIGRNLAVTDASGQMISQSGDGLHQSSKTLPEYDPGVRAVELADGRLLVTWYVRPTSFEFGGQRVQLYDLNGQSVAGPQQLDRFPPTDGSYMTQGPDLSVAALTDGRVLFAWSAGGNVVYSIYQGAALGVSVADASRTFPQVAGAGGSPQVAVLADGRFAIAWSDAGGDVMARVFTAAGDADGAAFHLGDITSGTQDTALIAALANGGLASAWRDASHLTEGGQAPDASGFGVKVQDLAPATAQGPHVQGRARIGSSRRVERIRSPAASAATSSSSARVAAVTAFSTSPAARITYSSTALPGSSPTARTAC
jgi:hypothetical protein